MFSDVVVIHRSGGQGSATLALALQEIVGCERNRNWFHWQTCLRQISVFITAGDESEAGALRGSLLPSDEIRRGDEGYRFLLEIICGLHSPLIGETEVYGQFKNAVADFQKRVPVTPSGSHLKRYFRALFEDAKRIRQNHLEDLGSQSYGSVLRRELRDLNLRRIHVIGAGQLVQEILPWLAKDEHQVHIHARDVVKARAQLGTQLKGDQKVHELGPNTRLDEAEAVVIAAPVPAHVIEGWLGGKNGARALALIVDLRADSATDQPRVSSALGLRHLVLGDVFARISQNQVLLAERQKTALAAVGNAVHERSLHVEYRPFGWEDVCA